MYIYPPLYHQHWLYTTFKADIRLNLFIPSFEVNDMMIPTVSDCCLANIITTYFQLHNCLVTVYIGQLISKVQP